MTPYGRWYLLDRKRDRVKKVIRTLTWASTNNVYNNPVFNLVPIEVGTIVELQIANNTNFSPIYSTDFNKVDSSERATGNLTFSGVTTLAFSTIYYARTRINGGIWSNVVSKTMS